MKNLNNILTVSTLALSLVSGLAYADTGKTNEPAVAEPVAAHQIGDVPVGFAAKTEREVFYGNTVGASPSHVQAVAASDQGGDTPLGFVAKTERELFPGNFAQTESSLTRAQVRAEMIAARAAGEMPVGFLARSERELFPSQYQQVEAVRRLAGTPSTQTR
jgi:hypothetical protein